MSATTTFPDTQPIPEGSCRVYSTQLVGLDGLSLSSAQIASIRFSLHDAKTNAVVNDRYRQEVLNINGGSLSPTAFFEMEFNEQDTIAIGGNKLQKRRAFFEIRFDNCTENHEVFFFVQNFVDIPGPPGGPRPQEDVHVVDGTVSAALV